MRDDEKRIERTTKKKKKSRMRFLICNGNMCDCGLLSGNGSALSISFGRMLENDGKKKIPKIEKKRLERGQEKQE